MKGMRGDRMSDKIKIDWNKAFKYIAVVTPLIVLLSAILIEVFFIFMATNILPTYLNGIDLSWYDYQTLKMSIYGVLIGCYGIAITVLFTIGGIMYFVSKWLDKDDEN